MEKMATSRRLRGLWGELGGVLDSQGGDGHRGQLNLIRGGSSTANLDGDEVLLLGAPVAERRSVLAGEKGTSRSWLPAGAPHRHGREHALGRDETAAHALAFTDPDSGVHRHEQEPKLIPPFLSGFAKIDQRVNCSQLFTKKKLVQNFVSYKTSLMTKDRFEVERDEFEPNSLKANLNLGKIPILN